MAKGIEKTMEKEIKRESGLRLAKARKAAGHTLESLSDRMEEIGRPMSGSRISNYEQGTRTIGTYEARSLGLALGISAAHLLCTDDDGVEHLPEDIKLLLDRYKNLPPPDKYPLLKAMEMLVSSFSGRGKKAAAARPSAHNAKKLGKSVDAAKHKEAQHAVFGSQNSQPVSNSKKPGARKDDRPKAGSKPVGRAERNKDRIAGFVKK